MPERQRPLPEWFAEPNRKSDDKHPRGSCHDEVAVLMNRYEHGYQKNEADYGKQKINHLVMLQSASAQSQVHSTKLLAGSSQLYQAIHHVPVATHWSLLLLETV